MYIDKLDDIMDKCNIIYHSITKMRPFDVNSSTYFEFNKENNKEDPKSKVGDHVRISKHKNNSPKSSVPNWSEEVFVIKKIKILCRGHILYLNVEEIVGTFYERESKIQIKKHL